VQVVITQRALRKVYLQLYIHTEKNIPGKVFKKRLERITQVETYHFTTFESKYFHYDIYIR